MDSQNILIKNGNVEEGKTVPYSAHDLLKMMRGAYTTARSTQDGECVFEFKFQIHRLMYTSLRMLQEMKENQEVNEFSNDDGFYSLSEIFDLDKFTQTIREMTKLGIVKWKEMFGSSGLEFKITLVIVFPVKYTYPTEISRESLSQSNAKCNIYLHLCPMPNTPKTVQVDVLPGTRFHWGNVKDTFWALERNEMNEKKLKSSNEVIMCEQDGSMREGISSNFFAIQKSNGKTITSNEGVLIGSTRVAVVPSEVADVFDIKLEPDYKSLLLESEYEIRAPKLSDLLEYEEVFITSTSRLLLPISKMNISKDCIDKILSKEQADRLIQSGKLKEEAQYYVYETDSTAKSEQLSKRLQSILIEKSTKL